MTLWAKVSRGNCRYCAYIVREAHREYRPHPRNHRTKPERQPGTGARACHRQPHWQPGFSHVQPRQLNRGQPAQQRRPGRQRAFVRALGAVAQPCGFRRSGYRHSARRSHQAGHPGRHVANQPQQNRRWGLGNRPRAAARHAIHEPLNITAHSAVRHHQAVSPDLRARVLHAGPCFFASPLR